MTLLTACGMFFVQKSTLKPSTLETYKSAALRLEAFLGDRSLNLITPEDLRRYVLFRVGQGAKIAVKRDLAFLSSLYSLAKTWPNGPTLSPFDQFKLRELPDAEKRTVWLTEREVETLLQHCLHDQHRLFVLMAVDTGMRKSEMLNLRWSEVDLDEGMIFLGNRDRARTKRGVGREIPLSPRLADTLRITPRRSEWVFPGPDPAKPVTTLKTFWRRVTRDANLQGVRIHDLRHTFGTRAQQRGVDVYSIMDLMGHSHITSSERYVHPSRESKRAAIRRMHG